MLRVVIDTNLWIRALLGGKLTIPVLEAWRDKRFTVIVSQHLIDELDNVWQRPRLRRRIDAQDAILLIEQLRFRTEMIAPPERAGYEIKRMGQAYAGEVLGYP